MLKRSFKDIDLSLPEKELEENPDIKSFLTRINVIEEKIDELIIKKKRVALAMNTEPAIRTKIMRIFVYSRFFKVTLTDPAHFIVHVDGVLLDADKSYYQPHMASFFDKVNAQVDKKFNQGIINADWNRDKCPQGASTDGFVFKLYHDKAALCKIQLHRNSDVRPRYELSSKLRSLVPLISVACSEEEVVLAVWQCVTSREDWFSRESKAVVCDNQLREVFGVESFNISTLRSLVQKHLLPLQPIQIEHHLNPQAPSLSSLPASTLRGFSHAYFVKCGGRAFDIEVDALDGHSFDQISIIHKMVLDERKVNNILGQKYAELAYLARKVNEKSQGREFLDKLNMQLSSRSSHSKSSSGSGDEAEKASSSSTSVVSSSISTSPLSQKAARRTALAQAAYIASSNPFRLIINRGVPKNAQTRASATARETRYQLQRYADREQTTEDSDAAVAHQRARSSSFEALKKELGGSGSGVGGGGGERDENGEEEEEDEDEDDLGEEDDEDDEEVDDERASTLSPFAPRSVTTATSGNKDQGGLEEDDDEDEDEEEDEEVNGGRSSNSNNNDNKTTATGSNQAIDDSGAMEITSSSSAPAITEKTERASSSSSITATATAAAAVAETTVTREKKKQPSFQKENFNALHKSDILGSMAGNAPSSALYADNATPGTAAALPLRKVASSGNATSVEQPLYVDSCIHGLSGYLDVGDDALFSASLPWVKRAVSLLGAAASSSALPSSSIKQQSVADEPAKANHSGDGGDSTDDINSGSSNSNSNSNSDSSGAAPHRSVDNNNNNITATATADAGSASTCAPLNSITSSGPQEAPDTALSEA